jgi:hypothetical protein
VSIRETMNQNKGITVAANVGLIVAIGAFIGWEMRSGEPGLPAPGSQPTKAYYSDDDGKSIFADDINRVPPFEHNGKTAVKANCFTVDGGKTHWIAYLDQFTPQGKRQMEAFLHHPIEEQDPIDRTHIITTGSEVKLPGAPDSEWTTPANSKKYTSITTVKAPPGKTGEPQPYTP